MRRFLVILLCSLTAVPMAVAASRATGDGVLELKSAYGSVAIGKEGQPARGALWGQMDKGRLTVVDPTPTDGQIFVSGWENREVKQTPDTGLPSVVVYSGTNLHFRVTGGKYRLYFNGSGIDLTAVGVGVAYLYGSDTVVDPGYYAVDSGDWLSMPVDPPKPLPVPFGAQPPLPPTQKSP